MTKKVIRNFGGRKSEFFSEKIELGKFFTSLTNFSEIGGNFNQGECIIASGWMDAPASRKSVLKSSIFNQNNYYLSPIGPAAAAFDILQLDSEVIISFFDMLTLQKLKIRLNAVLITRTQSLSQRELLTILMPFDDSRFLMASVSTLK